MYTVDHWFSFFICSSWCICDLKKIWLSANSDVFMFIILLITPAQRRILCHLVVVIWILVVGLFQSSLCWTWKIQIILSTSKFKMWHHFLHFEQAKIVTCAFSFVKAEYIVHKSWWCSKVWLLRLLLCGFWNFCCSPGANCILQWPKLRFDKGSK